MKKRGFTLIELLAVIVVLAIIALIATPIVMNTIKSAKKGAAERSADNYVKQVDVAVATERLNKSEVLDGEYQITNDGNLCRDKSASCLDDEKIKIEMNGTKPNSGIVAIKDSSVDKKNTSLIIGDYTVEWDVNGEISTVETGKVLCKTSKTLTHKVSDFVVTTGSENFANISDKVGYLASEKGKYGLGVEYTCNLGDSSDAKNLVFYVVEENGDNISLLGDVIGNSQWANYSDYLEAGGTYEEWTDCYRQCGSDSSCNNACYNTYGTSLGNQTKFGPVTANKTIATKTKNWTRISPSQIKLPTLKQVNVSESYVNYLDYGRGYWTSTLNEYSDYSNTYVYTKIESDYGYDTQADEYADIRPVITLSKSQLR